MLDYTVESLRQTWWELPSSLQTMGRRLLCHQAPRWKARSWWVLEKRSLLWTFCYFGMTAQTISRLAKDPDWVPSYFSGISTVQIWQDAEIQEVNHLTPPQSHILYEMAYPLLWTYGMPMCRWYLLWWHEWQASRGALCLFKGLHELCCWVIPADCSQEKRRQIHRQSEVLAAASKGALCRVQSCVW